MDKKIYLSLICSLTLMWGCSSSSTKTEGDEAAAGGDAIPELDAGTDAVPMGDVEKIDGDLALNDAALDAPADGAKAADPAAPADPALDMPADPALDAAAPAPAADPEMKVADAPAADPAAAPAPVPEAPAPVAEAAPPVSNDAGNDSGATEDYTVQRGDTLMKIAFETFGDLYEWKKIYEMNRDKLTDPNRIPPGTVLKLGKPSSPVSIDRNGEKFMIRPGDTLGTISDDIYGTPRKWKKLWENNRQLIKDPNKIFAGFYLYYSITPEEKMDADRLKQERDTAPQPLADGGAAPAEAAPQAATAVEPAMQARSAGDPQAMAQPQQPQQIQQQVQQLQPQAPQQAQAAPQQQAPAQAMPGAPEQARMPASTPGGG